MVAHPKTLSDYFEEGVEARADGRSQLDNPYRIGTDEHREWAEGWHAVCDLDEEDDPASTRLDSDIE